MAGRRQPIRRKPFLSPLIQRLRDDPVPRVALVAMVFFVAMHIVWRPLVSIDRVADADRLVAHLENIIFRMELRDPPPDDIHKWGGRISAALYGDGVEKWRPVVERHLGILSRLTGLHIKTVKFLDPSANFFIYIVENDQMAMVATRHTRRPGWILELVGPNRCIGLYSGSLGTIKSGAVVISSELTDDRIAGCLPEKITKLLGLTNHSEFVRPSIFSKADDHLAELTINDRILVRALYDDRLRPGMPRDEAMTILRDVIAELVVEARNGAAWTVAE